MQLSEFGKIVENEILKLPQYHPRVQLDEWVIMPNHIHLLIELTGNIDGFIPTTNEKKQYRKQRRKMIIPKILGKLQMQTSKQINMKRNTSGTKNWQSDYHDHIVRDILSYQRIKIYIRNNPENWKNDTFNNDC